MRIASRMAEFLVISASSDLNSGSISCPLKHTPMVTAQPHMKQNWFHNIQYYSSWVYRHTYISQVVHSLIRNINEIRSSSLHFHDHMSCNKMFSNNFDISRSFFLCSAQWERIFEEFTNASLHYIYFAFATIRNVHPFNWKKYICSANITWIRGSRTSYENPVLDLFA